jgi:hypothetical protein
VACDQQTFDNLRSIENKENLASMRSIRHLAFAVAAFMSFAVAHAADQPFTGVWSIDFRTPAERERKEECGIATVTLKQTGDKITGSHAMATVGCGRLNEGGEGTVQGVVVDGAADLVVTSGRNGAVAKGTAKLERGALRWKMVEEIKPGEPQGDSLIFWDGLLTPDVKHDFNSSTLITPSFVIEIKMNCAEGNVTCDNVTYVGTSKKSGKSITLRGRTKHGLCADGVTPCGFQGYEFKNGATYYRVLEDGSLLVTQGEKVLLEEKGNWER